MKLPFSRKGQGVIEAVLTLPLLILVGTGFIFSIYRGMVFYFADYQLHEALVCTESFPLNTCKEELKNRLHSILITKPRANISVVKGGSYTTGRIFIEMRPPLQLEQKIKGSSL